MKAMNFITEVEMEVWHAVEVLYETIMIKLFQKEVL
jgi:hypothetical protein